jgi:hypothetical protein
MDLSDAVNFARTNQWSVLTTIREDFYMARDRSPAC